MRIRAVSYQPLDAGAAAGFVPVEEKMQRVRTLWRPRRRHMRKALTKLNAQLANVLGVISGLSGLAIVSAILEEERDPYRLPDLRDERLRARRLLVCYFTASR